MPDLDFFTFIFVGEDEAAKNRFLTIQWYVEESERRWQEANYQNLELIGFYWLSENLDASEFDTKYLPEVGNYLRKKDYWFYWIPWFLAPGYERWDELGFDAVMMQPNYVFVKNSSKSRLTKAASEAKRYGMGLEIEADPVILGDKNARERYYDYLRTAITYGSAKDDLIAYYRDISVFSMSAILDIPEICEIYAKTYQFVKGNFHETF